MALTRRSTSPSCQIVSVTGRSSSSLAESVPSRLAKRSLRVKGWESASSREKSTTAKSAASAPVSSSVNCNPFISSRPYVGFRLAKNMLKDVFSLVRNSFHSIEPAIEKVPELIIDYFKLMAWPFFVYRSDLKYVNSAPVHTNSIKITIPFPWHGNLPLCQRNRLTFHVINRIFVIHFTPERKHLF